MGIDIDEKEINTARRRLKDKPITIKDMSGEKIEYPDQTFDLVNIAFSLHHMQNVNKTLSEMKRVLKKGGYFIITEMFSNGNQAEAQKCDTAAHEFGARIDRMLGIYHREEYTRDEILNILHQIELKDLDIFESSRYVKCLKCEEKYDCEDPKYSGNINMKLEEIDKNLELIKGYNEYSEFRDRAETIKQSIKNHGISSASILFCIGKKEV
jgi:SAM-dependent methyltransferase